MKTKMILGKSVRSVRHSLINSVYNSVGDSVDYSMYEIVSSSVSNLIRTSTRWNIKI
jgi:hypothetical protein